MNPVPGPYPPPVPSGTPQPDERDDLHLLEYWRILAQRRWVVAICLAAVVALTMVFTFFATPQYEAVTTLQIERQGPEILTFKDVLSVDPAAYQDFYQTQYKILQSHTVIRIAVERLDLMNNPAFIGRKGTPIGRLYRWLRSIGPGSGDRGDDPQGPALEFIEASLTIQPVRSSHLVKISFTDRNPELASQIANAMAEAYVQFNLDARYSTTSQAKEFLTKQVARIQSEISELEHKLQEYGSRKELLALSDGTQDISEKALADLNARSIDARGRLTVAEARYLSLRNASPDSLLEVLNSPLMANLRQQYAETERRYSQMAERFKPDWPAMKEAAEELSEVRERVEIEAQNIARQVQAMAQAEYQRARREADDIARQEEEQKDEVKRVNRDAIEYASLKAEIETKRKVRSDLAARESETEASDRLKDTRASNIRVVDPAETPKRPSRPKKILNLLLSIILGVSLGVGTALLLDYLDNTVKQEQDIERWAGLPVLGYIPLFQPLRVVYGEESEKKAVPPPPDLASHLDPRSAFAEAFKNLRTSLLLASPDHPPRHLVVTSCEPQEGKSTVSVNLAIALTQLGRRVLIVDADLRRPRLHKALSLPNAVGLSSLLSGNAVAEEIIQETPVPKLRAVTSGPIPPNPSELLGSPGLEAFLKRLREEDLFDHVIFDSPPLLQMADAVVLSSRMDGAIIVARAGSTGRQALAQGTSRLRQSRSQIIGAVLNALTEETSGYYYYRYRYYQGYESEQSAAGAASPSPRRMRRRSGHRV